MSKRIGGWMGPALLLGSFALLLWLERRKPLRRRVDASAARIAYNLGVAAVTGLTVAATERPITARLSRVVEARRWGLVHRLPVAGAVRTALALVLMDYSLYWWHVLLHRAPVLWRCHEPHHIDRDLDITTALRFHVAEFLASIPWRAAQILLIGVGPRTLSRWQTLTTLEVLFHHSNLRLPVRLERMLSRVIVTPRMHGIHHSVVSRERDSNFSSVLTLWDHLHATALVDMERDAVTIGIPGYERAEDVTLAATLALPFRRESARGPNSP
jgi:sterol desaturase/sphingolipid hydroxylase (fatty acid hydroxylase superfamily)